MTTGLNSPATPSAPTPTAARHRAIGWLAAAGTLPYLTLKALWLTGSTAGITDPAVLADPVIEVMNVVTVAMDAVVVVLAFALTHRWGDRIPAWLLLLPMWVGTGFLAPMALVIMPATALTTVSGTPGTSVYEPWLQPLVYGGFAWQGIFLGAAFAVHARRRWGAMVAVPAAVSRSLAPLIGVIAAGGAVLAVLSAALHLLFGVSTGDVLTAGTQAGNALFALAGAIGVIALVRTGTGSRWLATVAAWTGSSAMFSWGLYGVATTMVDNPLGGAHVIAGMARLTGLLGGFALAVAGLLVLIGTGVAEPARARS